VRVVRELAPTMSFRRAEVELCDDHTPARAATVRAALRRRFRRALIEVLPSLPEAQEQLDQLLGGDVSLGVLTDIVSYMLDLDLAEKEVLLAQTDVYRRTELLLEHLSVVASDQQPNSCAGGTFPPVFSTN